MSAVNNGPQIIKNGLVFNVDAAYMRSYSPNVYPNPTDLLGFNRMATQIQSCTVTRDPSQTRQYGSIPMKMSVTGNDPYSGAYGNLVDNLASALSGQTWTISVWAKASVATNGELFIFGADTNGAIFATPDYSAGTISITTSWQRFSFSYTFTNANTRYIQFRLDGTISGGSGTIIWWDGLQVEKSSSATQFNPYYFGNTIWRDISSNNYLSTLTNLAPTGPIFDTGNRGSIVFDGSNDFSTYTPTPTVLQGNPNLTVMGFYKRTANFSGRGFWGVGGSNAGGTAQGICNWNSTTTNDITIDSWSQSTFTTGQTYPLNTWIGVAWRKIAGPMTRANSIISIYDGTNLTHYTSTALTVLRAEAATNLAINSIGGITLGSISVDTGYCSPVNVGCHYIYNRVLTDTEVATNFMADKTRFGL
jgi:hypothetical protein